MNRKIPTLWKTGTPALLVMAVALSAATYDVEAEMQATYDPEAGEYIKGVIAKIGTTVENMTSGGVPWSTIISVERLSSDRYGVTTTAMQEDGSSEQVSYVVQVIDNSTYQIIIGGQISGTYTDDAEVVGGGSGRSSNSKASISLHSRAYGPTGTEISDSYTGCNRAVNHAEFRAFVFTDAIKMFWESNKNYWHLCMFPIGFSHVNINYGGTNERFNGEQFRNGNHSFISGSHGEATWHLLSAEFHYGSTRHGFM